MQSSDCRSELRCGTVNLDTVRPATLNVGYSDPLTMQRNKIIADNTIKLVITAVGTIQRMEDLHCGINFERGCAVEAGGDSEDGQMRCVHPADVCSAEDERRGTPWPLLLWQNAEEPWKEEEG
ncbi:hypothetical protein ACJRO7_009997 [Eucalyptus globulus]|uniref:Uncharacterized protein n=1 Tax=Eucalyptus globulus TaxID=34317 RepID=A0ABD3LE42_EUCGL